MRFPVFEHTANPAVDRAELRKSFAYCQELVDQGTHFWLANKHSGIQAYPPRSTESSGDHLLLGVEGDGALNFRDSVNNATGSADEKRVALRPTGKLTPAESTAMQKVRNYGKAS
jgi:hypothetical protein